MDSEADAEEAVDRPAGEEAEGTADEDEDLPAAGMSCSHDAVPLVEPAHYFREASRLHRVVIVCHRSFSRAAPTP